MQVTIIPISNDWSRDKRDFIKLQWKFYNGDPNFVPPVIADRKKLLDVQKNPFFRHSIIQLFLAERNGEYVGRIAAIINDNHNITHNDKVGFFGFFECENNQETANALFAAAGKWLQERGMDTMRGPVNPSLNDECGLLVEGFDSPPVVLMTYNPQYYAELIERAGFAKAKDLLAYKLEQYTYQSEKMQRMQNLLRERHKITVRSVNFKNAEQFKRDVHTIKTIYNAAWQPNWGFVKMTDEEFDFLVADLKQTADPMYTMIADVNGVPAGFALGLPDIYKRLIHNKKGSMLGAAWELFVRKRPIDLVRIIVLGVLPEYQKTGADAVLYDEFKTRGLPRGILYGEASWILEDNIPMNQALTKTMQGKVYKRYRLYDKSL